MRIDIMTLFPASVNAVLHESILGRAEKKGIIEINAVQIRDYTKNKQSQVDDYPYGGGYGCVMMAQPLKSCLDDIMSTCKNMNSRVIYLSPQGKPFTQETAKRLQRDYDHLVLVCGHYEGIDERFIELCVDEEISLGDYVLTGGEIAAMAIADSVCRLVPGVLADGQCYREDSHWDGLLEYPQYTRPETWEGRDVPDVLLSGNHSKIAAWRRRKQFECTYLKRPDMFNALQFSDKDDIRIFEDVMRGQGRPRLNLPLSYRRAVQADIPEILAIIEYARVSLKEHRVDQWQGDYPNKEIIMRDIDRGECFVVFHGDDLASFFTLSTRVDEYLLAITDGKWSSEDIDCCVLHRIAVAKKYRGTGISSYMLKCVDTQCSAFSRCCIRVDTHKNNKSMRNLLIDAGYRYRGNVLIYSEPGHDPVRHAYEKVLKDKGDYRR